MEPLQMGGYLPLELRPGKSFFQDMESSYVLSVNTGRTAIWCAILSLEISDLWIPYFYCPEVIAMLNEMDIRIHYYRLNSDFLPMNIHIKEGSDAAVLLVNYYGIIGDQLQGLSQFYTKIIFDNAHAFYQAPIIKDNVMNVYSCRKFFGVSDGAYLVGKGVKSFDLKKDYSSVRSSHLLQSLEFGTNYAYATNKKNEIEIGSQHLQMSLLTSKILRNINYDYVAGKRMENFKFLHSLLKDLQLLSFPDGHFIPYAYPFMLDRSIHKELVERNIYVPILWEHILSTQRAESIEYQFANHIMLLPIDQRYGKTELEYLNKVIREILKIL